MCQMFLGPQRLEFQEAPRVKFASVDREPLTVPVKGDARARH